MPDLGAARGVQTGAKMNKIVKNRIDFCNDFEFFLFRSWVDFGSKKLSKMRGFGVIFSSSLRVCEKCDFEQPSYGFAIFFNFKRVDFRPQNVYFSEMFSRPRFGLIFDRFWNGFGSKLGAKMESKSI